jgi:Ser/Thr protein kinase RdoA (MazF antagonist)
MNEMFEEIGLAGEEPVERMDQVASLAAVAYGCAPGPDSVQRIHQSENATYRISLGPGRDGALRVHRQGYQSATAIHSELAWIAALRRDIGLSTPKVMLNRAGSELTTIRDVDLGEWHCVAFEWVEGSYPGLDDSARHFEAIGMLSAQLHSHAATWRRPTWFGRFSWDRADLIGAGSRWGDWRVTPLLSVEGIRLLADAERKLADVLAAYGRRADRWGLIHADLRLENLLVGNDAQQRVIDFDDCGFGWWWYDLGAAMSFLEHDPRAGEWVAAWCHGYENVRPLPPGGREMAGDFIMLRRLALLGWVASHPDAYAAGHLTFDFVDQTCRLAEEYGRNGLRELVGG